MNPDDAFRHYQELQVYVGWTDEAGRQVAAASELVAPYLAGLVDDFYDEIERHPEARKVITGGAAQIARLKGTLLGWLKELFCGRYDSAYVARRWRVGWRHVEIGLDQVYTNVALSRLRTGLVRTLHQHWQGDEEALSATVRSLNTLLDLDLALIEDAYQAEYASRLQASERLAALGQVALARERSEAAFRTLVEAAPCLIVILSADHALIYFSPYAEVLTGCAADAVVGRDFLTTFLPEEQRPAAAERFRRALEGAILRGSETPILCRDGSLRWLLLNVRPLPDPPTAFAALHSKGAPVHGPAVLLVGQDITALKQAQERTLQAERLAAIGQMVTGLAHESGNALARSQACLEMLLLEVQDRPEALDLAGRIQKAQDHLRQLYDEVRNYAAPLRLERQVCGLDTVWRQAWANLAVQRQGRLARLHEHTGSIDLRCSFDPFRLEQVFRNILENALAACRDPVEISVSCQETSLHGQAGVRVSVLDNGPGLDAEQRRRLFEPFYTTKTKGTGLGMAIARRIVEAHGGDIVAPSPLPLSPRGERGRGEGAEPSGANIQLTLPRESP